MRPPSALPEARFGSLGWSRIHHDLRVSGAKTGWGRVRKIRRQRQARMRLRYKGDVGKSGRAGSIYTNRAACVCGDVTQSILRNFDFSWPSEVELVSNSTTWEK